MKTVMGHSPKYGHKDILVDDEDFEYVSKFKWFLRKVGNTFYAQHNVKVNGSWTAIQMHRELLSAPVGSLVDHKNHNTLDNRRENIRICSCSQNNQNKRIVPTGSSRYKGVAWATKEGKWRAMITTQYYTKHLGLFVNEIDAALTYDYHAHQEHGEYALLNFPEKLGSFTPPPIKRKLPADQFKGSLKKKVSAVLVIPEQPKAAVQQSLFL